MSSTPKLANGNHHPCRRQKTMIQIRGRPATWVHRLVRLLDSFETVQSSRPLFHDLTAPEKLCNHAQCWRVTILDMVMQELTRTVEKR